jgi:uncharacterized protein YpmS
MLPIILLTILLLGFISLFITVSIEIQSKRKRNERYEKYVEYYTKTLHNLNDKVDDNLKTYKQSSLKK